MTDIVNLTKKIGVVGSQDIDLRDVQELINTRSLTY